MVQQRTNIESMCWGERVVHNWKCGMELCEESTLAQLRSGMYSKNSSSSVFPSIRPVSPEGLKDSSARAKGLEKGLGPGE